MLCTGLLIHYHVIVVSGLFCITAVNIAHSLFWLSFCYLIGALLILFIGLEWLGILILLVYSGAISIVFLITLAMTTNAKWKETLSWGTISNNPMIGSFLCIILILFILTSCDQKGSFDFEELINIENIGIGSQTVNELSCGFFERYGLINLISVVLLLLPMILVLAFVE